MTASASASQTDRALLDAVFSNGPLGLAFWDEDLRYRRINEALARMNGTSAEAHLGQQPVELLGELGERVQEMLQRVLDTREPVVDLTITGETPTRPGVLRHWRASYYPVLADDGEPLGVAGAVIEVTDEHNAEEERRHLLKDALSARAHAEAAQIRAEVAQEAAEAERARTAFLADAGRRMAQSMDYEATLQRVAEIAVPTVADWCAITLKEPGGWLRTVAVAHLDHGTMRFAREFGERHRPRLSDTTGSGHVIRTGELQFITEITDELVVGAARDPEHLAALRSLGLRSAIVAPLPTPDGVIGALSVAMAESGRSFQEQDLPLVTELAARAALQIRNAQLYTERSHIARTLQAGLLPRELPEIPGMEVAARYLAAGDQNDVGGDFYDVFRSDEAVWTTLIGDVSGKGPEAAAVTALARHTLRTASLRDDRPSEKLQVLNRAMLADAESMRFCTVAYARVCPSDGGALITLSNGGHLPPLILRADGSLEPVTLAGTLVGGVTEPTFADCDVRLEAGDLILFYTDGVTELRTADYAEGERRLAAVLRANAGASAEAIVAAVQQAAVDRQSGEPRDDMALLALRVLPA